MEWWASAPPGDIFGQGTLTCVGQQRGGGRVQRRPWSQADGFLPASPSRRLPAPPPRTASTGHSCELCHLETLQRTMASHRNQLLGPTCSIKKKPKLHFWGLGIILSRGRGLSRHTGRAGRPTSGWVPRRGCCRPAGAPRPPAPSRWLPLHQDSLSGGAPRPGNGCVGHTRPVASSAGRQHVQAQEVAEQPPPHRQPSGLGRALAAAWPLSGHRPPGFTH